MWRLPSTLGRVCAQLYLKTGEKIMDKVWGTKEGLCAWCDDKAQTEYVGVMTNGETVEYQVCLKCDKEMN